MNRDKLKAAIAEAERFLKRAKEIKPPERVPANWRKDGETFFDKSIPGKQSGAVKRASMDLTRALADLRRPEQ